MANIARQVARNEIRRRYGNKAIKSLWRQFQITALNKMKNPDGSKRDGAKLYNQRLRETDPKRRHDAERFTY